MKSHVFRRLILAAGLALGLGNELAADGDRLVAAAEPSLAERHETASQPSIKCYFSPSGGCTDAVVKEIEAAKKSIHVQAYSFTSAPIAKALEKAKKRGVDVVVIFDKSNLKERSEIGDLHDAGVTCLIDSEHTIAHNKVMLIDDRTLMTGSFNYTHSAELYNAENLLVIHDAPDVYKAYEANFHKHRGHSEKYDGR